jgi:predicted metallopeptidase
LQEFDKIDLFSQVYNKRHMHLELVKRSAEIIKLYARNKKLTSLHIDKVWDCTDIDETMQIEIYNVVQATGSAIHDQDLEKFILKVKNQEPSKITLREIEFLHQIGKSAHQKSAARLLAIQALWQCALLEKPGYSLDLLSTARKHCFDLLRTQEREVIEQYVMQALLIVEQKTGTSLQALKLFKKLVDLIPKNCYNTYYM